MKISGGLESNPEVMNGCFIVLAGVPLKSGNLKTYLFVVTLL